MRYKEFSSRELGLKKCFFYFLISILAGDADFLQVPDEFFGRGGTAECVQLDL